MKCSSTSTIIVFHEGSSLARTDDETGTNTSHRGEDRRLLNGRDDERCTDVWTWRHSRRADAEAHVPSRKGDYPFIYGHYGATSVQVQKAFELVINDKFPAEQVISKVLPLSRINDAIEFTRTGEALRVVLVPDGKESEHHGK